MANYYIINRNKIQRRYIIQQLEKKGYKFYNSDKEYYINQATDHALIAWGPNTEFAGTIDTGCLFWQRNVYPGFVKVTNVKDIPPFIRVVSTPEVSIAPTPVAVALPKAQRYSVTYEKTNGEIKNFIISNPIEEDANKVTVYAFGSGIKSLLKRNIRSFSKI